MEVLTAAAMRIADRLAIENLGIPGLILMENAGRLVAEAVMEHCATQARCGVVVLAGAGNNGGDGFVAARHLARMGVACEVVLAGARLRDLSGDAATMAGAWSRSGGPVVEIVDEKAWSKRAPELRYGSVVIDALFGTGLTRPLDGLAAVIVEHVNRAPVVRVAVDIPSGLPADGGPILGPAIDADLTVTFARPKPVHLLPPTEDLCGEVVVVDIGIPLAAILGANPQLHWTTLGDAAQLVPERELDEHKGNAGHVLVVAGSTGRAGAAALAGWGALRAGAGLTTVATPAAVRAEVAGFAAEIMTEALPDGRGGALARGAATRALALAKTRSVLAIGPGLGTAAATVTEVQRLVRESPVPVVLDADGLNAFAGAARRKLAQGRRTLIVTPHPGEAARLYGVDAATIQSDRLAWTRRLARETRSIAVLKGYRTLIAAPDGQAFINPTGNPGMASGGMGDVLTGIIAGLIAQQMEPLEAAVLGVYLHGLAADLAVAEIESEPSLTASAVLEHLPEAFRSLESLDDGDDDGSGDDDAENAGW